MDQATDQDAITTEEIQGSDPVSASASASTPAPKNAFAMLMEPKPKSMPKSMPSVSSPSSSSSSRKFWRGREGLGAYIESPASFSSRVIYHTPAVVAIRDLYPKATIHTLLLPRSAAHNLQHPFDAFDDPVFLAVVKRETANLRRLVAAELRRKLGADSAADAQRQAVLSGAVDAPDDAPLPAGRDWEKAVRCGVHMHPSMSHVHVHVLSRDMHSPCVKHQKHYNSFTTPFFVDMDDFPLAHDDPRRGPGRAGGYLKQDFVCWRCGANFGNQFAKLKRHLDEEFEAWRRE